MTLPETLDGRRLPLPKRWATRPRDPRGWPVPWFVAEVAPGQFDFRVADERKRTKAVRENRCWLCGETLGRFKCFAIGPMCAINRILERAAVARRVCRVRRPRLSLPDPAARQTARGWIARAGGHNPGGISLDRNPGVTLLWVSVRYTTFRTSAADGPGIATGWLINVGDPEAVRVYARDVSPRAPRWTTPSRLAIRCCGAKPNVRGRMRSSPWHGSTASARQRSTRSCGPRSTADGPALERCSCPTPTRRGSMT